MNDGVTRAGKKEAILMFRFLKGTWVCVCWGGGKGGLQLFIMPHYPTSQLPFWAFRSILWPPTSWTIEARTFPSEQRWSQQQEHDGCSWETNCLLCSRMDSPPMSQSLYFHTQSQSQNCTPLHSVKQQVTAFIPLNHVVRWMFKSPISSEEGVNVSESVSFWLRMFPFDPGHKICIYIYIY